MFFNDLNYKNMVFEIIYALCNYIKLAVTNGQEAEPLDSGITLLI